LRDLEYRKKETVRRIKALKREKKAGQLQNRKLLRKAQKAMNDIARERTKLEELPSDAYNKGEIRVDGHGVNYAAPTLIVHYIENHKYRPPDEFIEAVIRYRLQENSH